jgi:hypothetical protein
VYCTLYCTIKGTRRPVSPSRGLRDSVGIWRTGACPRTESLVSDRMNEVTEREKTHRLHGSRGDRRSGPYNFPRLRLSCPGRSIGTVID